MKHHAVLDHLGENRHQITSFIKQTFDADENNIFDSIRSHRPDKALKRNLSVNLPMIKAKWRKSLQIIRFTSIIKK